MEHGQFDDLAGWKQQRQAEWHARISTELAAFQAQQDAYDPAAQAEIHAPRPRRQRKELRACGHRLTGTQEFLLQQLAFLNDLGIVAVTVHQWQVLIWASLVWA